MDEIFSFFIKDPGCYNSLVAHMSSQSIPLIVYSHIPAAIITLILGVFLLTQSTHLKIRIFFSLTLTFFFFILADLGQQLTFLGRDVVLFSQSFLELIEPLIMILTFYFFYYIVRRKDAPFYYKVLGLMPLIPIYVIVALQQNLVGYNYVFCRGLENPILVNYIFIVDLFYFLIAVIFSLIHVIKNKSSRKEVLVSAIGACLFMGIFFTTQNIFNGRFLGASFNKDYYLIYSFFCMPFAVAFLAYLAVRFKVFKVRLVTSQLFVLSVFILILSQFFFLNNTISVILNTFLIFFMVLISHIIMTNVKQEVRVREHIEELAQNLSSANQTLKKTNIKLEELNLQKTEFISIATHQLRGPLGSIKGYASMILEGDFGKVNKDLKNAIETMMKSTQSLVVIVDDYLNVSRIEQGRMKYDFSDFDVKELVKTIIEEFSPVVERAHLDLSFDYNEKERYPTHADMGKIKQVFINLLDNSIKYTPHGSIKIKLEKSSLKKIRFSITDTGVGINPEVIPQLFNRFTRAPEASKTNILGTGLGLFVAKKMVEAHQGKIWVESKGDGQGSSFFVELHEG